MIARNFRSIGILASATTLIGLAGCTSGLESAARQELKSNPSAGTSIAMQQPAEPGPLVPGSNSHAPVPTSREAALQNPADAPTVGDAVAVMDAKQNDALQTPAMPASDNPDTLTTLADASTDTELPQEVTSVQTIVPTPKPGDALAYAAPSAANAGAALDSQFDVTPPATAPDLQAAPATTGPTVINSLIRKYAAVYDIPEALVHRVVHRESRYNPAAFNNGHYGLMQIKYATAKSMGYRGPANGLFDAENNLKYAIKYLRGAWLVADKSSDNAVRLYARGYYYDAKRRGMLHVFR